MKRRILSILLVLCMVLGMMPVSAFAAETDNLCDHHTEHTADCGYAPAVEGSPCTHECGEECAEACTHAHDALCGYVEAAAEVPCGYVCEESHGEATRVIYVDESTFLASGYSRFYDANENQLTTTREEQEDGWVKYTMPADAKYYLTFDGHLGGGGGDNYPELPTNADTYDPVLDTWSCSHPGYAEGNCRLCGAPCPGHTYDNACDAECNVCSEIREVGDHVYDNDCDADCNVCYFVREGSGHVYDNACDAECNVCSEIREVGDHVYDGAEDAECNECGFVRTVGPALITGMSITIDGVVYDSSNTSAEDPAVITPNTEFITITVYGTALQNCTTDHMVSYYSGSSEPILPDYLWHFEADGTSAYHYYSSASALSDFARNTTPYELQYSNNGSFNAANPAIGSGVYIVYDDGTGGEEDTTPAEITGVTVTVDGETHTSGNVTITPTSTITLTVTGTNLQNGTDDNRVNYADGFGQTVSRDYFEINEDGTTATDAPPVNFFANSSNFEIKYYNNYTDIYNRTAVPTGIYLTYDDSTGGEEDTTPDSTGKILVDMQDSYGDGWNDAAIQIYKNGSLETTVTVGDGKAFNTVFLDYDSTATYEFKWIKGSYDYECSFTIYEDGEEKLSVTDASVYENGETIWPQGDTGGEEDTTSAEITGVTVTVDGVLYTSGNVTITPTSTIIFTVTGTNFANLNDNNYLGYYFSTIVASSAGFTIDTAANTATRDFTGIISQFEECDDFEVMYSNDGTQSWIGTGIYLTYDDGTGEEGGDDPIEPDTTPAEITGVSITVDGETYTEGNVTITPETESIIVTVTGTNFANVSDDNAVDLGPGLVTFLNTFRWDVNPEANTATLDASGYNDWFIECDNDEVTYMNGDTLIGTGIYLTYDDGTGGEEDTTPAEITGVSITIDGVTYDSTNTSAESPAVFTPETQSMIVTVNGTALQAESSGCWISYTPRLSCNPIDADRWTISEDGSCATGDAVGLRDILTVTLSAWEIIYGNTMSDRLSSGVYLKFETAVAGKIVVDAVSSLDTGIWNGAAIEIYKNGELVQTVTVTEYVTSVSIDYDPTASYEFKWVAAEGAAGDFAIYVDGETMLEVSDVSQLVVDEIVLTIAAAEEPSGPVITKQPEDASAKLGENFCVTVEATGDELTYQWYFKNKGSEAWRRSSQKDNTYDDVMTSARAGREVKCVITDAAGNKVTTETAFLIGVPTAELAITQQPTDSSAKLGENFCATVEAVGDGLKYQWYFKNAGSAVWRRSGQRDNTYDDVMTAARHNRQVYCVITDAWGNSVTSDTVTLSGIPETMLAITQQPNNSSAKLGEDFCVTVEAEGDGLTYRWYFRKVGTDAWRNSSVRDNTYDDVMTAARHNREVKCVITDAWGNSVTTDIATITGTPTETLAITAQPADAETALGDNFCVTVEAVGDGLKYQWYFKNAGSDVWRRSSQKDNTYDDVMTKARAGREIYCVITDAWGSQLTTETVTLKRNDT